MAQPDSGWFERVAEYRRWVLAGMVALAVLLVFAGWALLQSDETPPPAGMLERDEELPEEIPELPADITYDERQDVLPPLVELRASSAEELEEAFAAVDYDWPPESTVPAVSVRAFPPLGDLTVDERRSLFFRTLLPLVLAENQVMLATRERIQTIFAEGDVEQDSREARLLQTLADRFRVDGDLNSADFREELLRRVDVVPADMALAQAANESGWGQSRFTREANNLFGVWTWHENRGIVPERRAAGATHFVRVFPNLRASVRNYLYTINVGDAYSGLRDVREQARADGDGLSGLYLATGLERYSERGEAYVAEIQSMIRSNNLAELSGLELTPVEATRLLGEQ
ncbi:glucosaminidase domain-containing protein [Aquisalimonas asiatica]|uniref:Bax protein n=1 Tax=Aquisalimonas asiatica TaxID=406100 RepID=A0A1H8SAU5_9GAMM|nr:glucosaminidase domain-containing protein [Aquisalimonas asiatica]SEO75752.1 Bax protein [Aquisalimonas asiatica]